LQSNSSQVAGEPSRLVAGLRGHLPSTPRQRYAPRAHWLQMW
jgi:hypothetical protein